MPTTNKSIQKKYKPALIDYISQPAAKSVNKQSKFKQLISGVGNEDQDLDFILQQAEDIGLVKGDENPQISTSSARVIEIFLNTAELI